jgi:hypothetical protein
MEKITYCYCLWPDLNTSFSGVFCAACNNPVLSLKLVEHHKKISDEHLAKARHAEAEIKDRLK